VRSPTTTGKIERFHQSLRHEFLADRTFDSLEAAQAELDAWVADYNTARPHQTLEMATPAERFRLTPLAKDSARYRSTRPRTTLVSGSIKTVARARSGPVRKVRADVLHVKHQPTMNRQGSAGT
jgi:integrase-like protein